MRDRSGTEGVGDESGRDSDLGTLALDAVEADEPVKLSLASPCLDGQGWSPQGASG